MEFINNTPSPALSFEGVDTQQAFHVIVMRQTYSWDETGLLSLAEEQDPLCMMDEIVDPKDVMSGVLQESDLCHYKPKCDVIVNGHAYAPKRKNVKDFIAAIHVQTPNKVIFAEPIKSAKYQFEALKKENIKQQQPRITKRIKGDVLIDKKLLVGAEQYIERIEESVIGNYRLFAGAAKKVNKVSLDPSSSLGGYCVLDEEQPNLEAIDESLLIPENERSVMPLKDHTAAIAYFSQDNGNPYGTGYLTPEYIKALTPKVLTSGQLTSKQIALPQLQYPTRPITDVTLTQLLNSKKDNSKEQEQFSQMIAGFGICAKSHPARYQYMGTIDDAFIARGKQATEARDIIPEGFDFAIWNCAYPDQQTEHLKGNEWITLTNLCDPDSPAAITTSNGDTKLTLYLPESFATLITRSSFTNYPDSEVLMKLDTVSINPDTQKVHLVSRGIIAADYEPEIIVLEYVSPEKHAQVRKEHFTQKGDIVRPYAVEQGA